MGYSFHGHIFLSDDKAVRDGCTKSRTLAFWKFYKFIFLSLCQQPKAHAGI